MQHPTAIKLEDKGEEKWRVHIFASSSLCCLPVSLTSPPINWFFIAKRFQQHHILPTREADSPVNAQPKAEQEDESFYCQKIEQRDQCPSNS